MSDTELSAALLKALWVMKMSAPFKTGNLRYNAIKLESIGNGEWKIFVDQNIAPYMPYTNEKWISPHWNGKKNPNQKWWDKSVKETISYISSQIGGVKTVKEKKESL